MPVNKADIERLLTLLGMSGARSGLFDGSISTRELQSLCEKLGVREYRSRRAAVDGLLEMVASAPRSRKKKRISKAKPAPVRTSSDLDLTRLRSMDVEQMREHFARLRVSQAELMELANRLGFKPSADDKKHLAAYVARQIAETAMFERVAKGEGA